jgi:HEAT repeat protein
MDMMSTSSAARSSTSVTTTAPAVTPAPAPAPPPPAKPAGTLAERLRSTDNDVVLVALNEVVQNDNVPAALIPELERIIKQHPDGDVRVAAIETVGMADNRAKMLPAVGACLQHANEEVRAAAMDVIADTESKVSIDILIAQRNSAYADVREAAQDNLEVMTGKEFTNQIQWRAWWTVARPTFSFD